MNAEEARKISEANRKSLVEKEYMKCKSKIKVAVKEGHFSVVVNSLFSDTIEKLNSEGYSIEVPEKSSYNYISW